MKSLSYLATGLTLSIAPPGAAQAREALSLDATVGVSGASGSKGLYTSSASVAGEVTLGVRLHPEREFAALAEISFGRRARFEGNGDSRCVVQLAATTSYYSVSEPDPLGILGRFGERSLPDCWRREAVSNGPPNAGWARFSRHSLPQLDGDSRCHVFARNSRHTFFRECVERIQCCGRAARDNQLGRQCADDGG